MEKENKMNKLKLTFSAACLLLMAATIFTPATAAIAATGQNAILDSAGGIYIPLNPGTSGELGDLIGGVGPGQIGLTSDVGVVTGIGDTTGGSVFFDVLFDFSAETAPWMTQLVSGVLTMQFTDLDLQPVGPSTFKFQEYLDLQIKFIGGAAVGNVVSLDENNYDLSDFNATDGGGNPLGPDFVTDNQTVNYEFELGGPTQFALNQTELDQILADEGFVLTVLLSSKLERLLAGTTSGRNTLEDVNPGDFNFVAVPEPATVLVLTCGAGLLAIRRRRR